MSDREVILKIKNGEIDYFEVLVRKYSKVILFLFIFKNKKDGRL